MVRARCGTRAPPAFRLGFLVDSPFDLIETHAMTLTKILGASFVVLLAFASSAAAEISLTTTRVASGLSLPIFATAPPGDTGRLFIVEQGGNSTAKIRILDLSTDTLLPTPFLTISGIDTGGERGLLGLAFHPDYAANGYFYVYVSDTSTSN